jgi:hypothetical protein
VGGPVAFLSGLPGSNVAQAAIRNAKDESLYNAHKEIVRRDIRILTDSEAEWVGTEIARITT